MTMFKNMSLVFGFFSFFGFNDNFLAILLTRSETRHQKCSNDVMLLSWLLRPSLQVHTPANHWHTLQVSCPFLVTDLFRVIVSCFGYIVYLQNTI